MNCSEAEQLFDAYLDDELSGSIRLEFDAHRLRCPVCQQKLAMMEACEHILSRDGRMPELSDDFTDRVMGHIAQTRTRPARRRRRLVIYGLQAAAVLVFAVVVAGFWKPGEAPQPEKIVAAQQQEFLEKVDHAIETKDRDELLRAMSSRADQLAAGPANLQVDFQRDVDNLVRLARTSLIDQIFALPEAIPRSPLEYFMQIFSPGSPAPADEPDGQPAPPADESFSL